MARTKGPRRPGLLADLSGNIGIIVSKAVFSKATALPAIERAPPSLSRPA
jgi:hypothetical protein